MLNTSRLISARRRRRLTSKELASAAGISPITLSRIETGASNPNEATVMALAVALRYPIQFLLEDDLLAPDPSSVSFRSMSGMTAGEREAALAAGAIAFMLADWVDERFNLPKTDVIDGSQERNPASVARALRQHWQLGEQPIPDMVRLLEAKGIRVFSLSENTRNVDAFSCWRGDVPYVFLNTFKTSEHSRFDAAHELGHLVLHRHGGPNQGRAAELEAQLFAASFLMPEPDVRAKMPRSTSLDGIVSAKKRWGVSAAALAYRLHKLQILSDWAYRGIVIEIGRRGFRTAEPVSMPRETSEVWRQILRELWSERITTATIASHLHLPEEEIESLLFGLARSLPSHENHRDELKAGKATLTVVTGEPSLEIT